MLAFLNTPTFPVFSPPTYFNPAFILRFYLSFIFYLAFIYCVLLFTNIIYHVMRTDTCNKPHTLRDAETETETFDGDDCATTAQKVTDLVLPHILGVNPCNYQPLHV